MQMAINLAAGSGTPVIGVYVRTCIFVLWAHFFFLGGGGGGELPNSVKIQCTCLCVVHVICQIFLKEALCHHTHSGIRMYMYNGHVFSMLTLTPSF